MIDFKYIAEPSVGLTFNYQQPDEAGINDSSQETALVKGKMVSVHCAG